MPTLLLPEHFRCDDFFAFHLRDQQSIAEIVENKQLRKGIIWHNNPAQINLRIDNQQAIISLDIDSSKLGSSKNTSDEEQIVALGKNLLGLHQGVEQFEECYLTDPRLGKLIKNQRGLRIYQSASPFEALVWAIIGQQISVHAAIAIRRRFIQAVGMQHSSGIWCFPNEQQVNQVDDDTLRQTGFSTGKIVALRALCDAIKNQQLDLSVQITSSNIAHLTEQLLSIKGIGPWTVSYALLRGFNYLDGSLHGDVAVRRNLQILLTQDEQPNAKETEKWLAQYSPWRALVAAHLWRSQSAAGY